MIGILIITHGDLAEELLKSAAHVLGGLPPQAAYFSVEASDDPAALLPKAQAVVAQLDTGEGVLICSDICGATPCNIACKLIVPGKVEVITGVNLPMLVRVFTYRHKDMATLLNKAQSGGCEGVMHLSP